MSLRLLSLLSCHSSTNNGVVDIKLRIFEPIVPIGNSYKPWVSQNKARAATSVMIVPSA